MMCGEQWLVQISCRQAQSLCSHGKMLACLCLRGHNVYARFYEIAMMNRAGCEFYVVCAKTSLVNTAACILCSPPWCLPQPIRKAA